MLTYIIAGAECRGKAEPHIRSWVPSESDIRFYDDCSSAINAIQAANKACSVIVECDKIEHQGQRFIESVKSISPCSLILVICATENCRTKIREIAGSCESVWPINIDDITLPSTRDVAVSAFGKVALIAKLDEAVGEIRTKVESLQERTRSWGHKFRMIS